jgi:hypothetical protein
MTVAMWDLEPFKLFRRVLLSRCVQLQSPSSILWEAMCTLEIAQYETAL